MVTLPNPLPSTIHEALDALFESRQTTIARDLKLNLKRFLSEASLSPDEGLLNLLAISTSVGEENLAKLARHYLAGLGVTEEQIQEAAESAAIMGMNNVYYRFRHMVQKDEEYRTAGLRMTGMARPALGKEKFEMLAFSVSVINGCEQCIRAHEKALRDTGASADKVHDLARLAATVKGIQGLQLK